jgi:hypothetical protein
MRFDNSDGTDILFLIMKGRSPVDLAYDMRTSVNTVSYLCARALYQLADATVKSGKRLTFEQVQPKVEAQADLTLT